VRVLVTGGAGFIGSNLVRYLLRTRPEAAIVVLDKFTYAGNLANLADVRDHPRLSVQIGDIADPDAVEAAIAGCTHVINVAAETHVDRSILESDVFLRTNIDGTRALLEAAGRHDVERYLQLSTDEVYGPIEAPDRAGEEYPLKPRSPYAASKAGADLLVGAYHATFGIPTLVTRGANTYGPFQYPEKLIPLFVTNALENLTLPVYGDGQQIRDWLAVEDHCSAILAVLEHGAPGHIYNVEAGNARPNIEIVRQIVELLGVDPALVQHVPDRPGHDRRYALRTDKLRALGWQPAVPFEEGLRRTVEWYREHREWWEPIKSGTFREYYQRQYAVRLAEGRR